MNIFILTVLLIILINYILLKKNKLLNFTGFQHQKFTSTGLIPLSGGIVLLFTSYFYINLETINLIILIFLIFLIGFSADLKKLNSPLIRLIIQMVVIIASVYFTSINVTSTKVLIIDYFLQNNFFRIIFSSFCILIILNGSNFIDGLNTLTLGYYIIITTIIIFLEKNGILVSNIFEMEKLLYVLITLFLFNSLNKLYLGDSGSYFLGFIFSLFLIETHQISKEISPFFIVLLLWYPAFENLFSILRKIKFSRSPVNPDINHLHHLIFHFLLKNSKLAYKYLNTISALIINTYNILIMYMAYFNYSNSQLQILLIIFNIAIYVFIYTKLFSYKMKKN